jgi:glucose/arabinose dehydrogenase
MKLTRLLALLSYLFSSYFAAAQSVTVTPFVSGLTNPIDIRHCGDDRLFVAERNGRIRVINPDGTLRASSFLDIVPKISSAAGEEGLLGFCFSPNFQTNGKFYVSYTANIASQLTSVVEEYRVSSSDPNVADPTTNLVILSVAQPASNHNGGNIMFGPDGFLYIFFGDGGGGGDPFANGQNKTTLLGKILRLDLSNSSQAVPYTIPPTNPFFNTTDGTKKEIWAYGLRNPWRNSFDRITNDLWIADVGQGAREEINFQPANSLGGENYGWNIMEGTICYPPPATGCNTAGLKMPIYDYSHSVGSSITGGTVYRSIQSRALWGFYLYSDFNFSPNKWLDGFKQSGGVIQGSVVRLINNVGSTPPIAFGEDRYGEIYMCLNGNGTLFKVEDANPNRFPKAFFTNTLQNGGQVLLNALPGRNMSYQWLLNDAPISGATGLSFLATNPGQYKLSVTNGLNNTDISAAFSLGALPVTLKKFTANRVSSNIIQLEWITANEQNNKGFEIERKKESESGFSVLQFISSQVANAGPDKEQSYSYTDNSSSEETVLYRLKQIDEDGRNNYSTVLLVKGTNNKPAIFVHPNPAKDYINITLGTRSDYQLQWINSNGQVLAQNNFSGAYYRFGAGTYKKGIYYIKITDTRNGISTTQKIVLNE